MGARWPRPPPTGPSSSGAGSNGAAAIGLDVPPTTVQCHSKFLLGLIVEGVRHEVPNYAPVYPLRKLPLLLNSIPRAHALFLVPTLRVGTHARTLCVPEALIMTRSRYRIYEDSVDSG